MKKQLLRTLTASILLMSTSVLAEQAPSRTECIAPAKPGGGFDPTCKLIHVSMMVNLKTSLISAIVLI